MFVVVVGGGDKRKKRDGDGRTTDGRGKYATNTRAHTHTKSVDENTGSSSLAVSCNRDDCCRIPRRYGDDDATY